MEVFFDTAGLVPEWSASVACIGTFDGVHLGHREVIGAALDRASDRGLPALLITFDRNPAAILAPEKCPPAIASLDSNLQEFASLGIAATFVLRFDRAFSDIHATEFLKDWLIGKFHAATIVVGHDFTFGKDREGTPDWLKSRFDTLIVSPYSLEGERVSSSRIRSAISHGDLRQATRLLGRPFEIPGIVVEGDKLGRTLGYPTLNIARSFRQIGAADGIYAALCSTPCGLFKAAASIGSRPMVGGKPTIEAYLIDYPGGDLYGAPVKLSLIEKLREQAKFSSLEDLKRQIATDVEAASNVN